MSEIDDLKAELSALEKDATRVLESDLPDDHKRELLNILFTKYAKARKLYEHLLVHYRVKMRRRTDEQAPDVVADLLLLPQFRDLSMTVFAALLLFVVIRPGNGFDVPLLPIPGLLVLPVVTVNP